MGEGTGEGLCFDVGFLADSGTLSQCLHHAYLDVLRGPFKTGFGHYTDHNMPFKR